MKISAKTEYACVAMLELAAQYESDRPVRIREIAERHKAPSRFLIQILLQLKGAGLVASTRGAAGGYRLTLPPDQISLGRVMESVEGPSDEEGQAGGHVASDSPAARILLQTWKEVAAVERKMLSGITLADLLDRAKQKNEPMYII